MNTPPRYGQIVSAPLQHPSAPYLITAQQLDWWVAMLRTVTKPGNRKGRHAGRPFLLFDENHSYSESAAGLHLWPYALALDNKSTTCHHAGMRRPLIIDLYCGLGGAAMGYFLAGWDVWGVDSEPQPDYPFKFIQADITKMNIRWKRAQAVHASPPCKVHTLSRHQSTNHTRQHEDLIPVTRELLEDSGLPYVIENVPTAPLIDPLMLCGSMFGLHTENYELKRHRLFEANWAMPTPPPDRCGTRTAVSVYGDHAKITGQRTRKRDGATVRGTIDMPNGLAYQLMGITWATSVRQFSQAIPPAYTQFLGYWLRKQL